MSRESRIGILFFTLTVISYFIATGFVAEFQIKTVDVKLILVASFFVLLVGVIWLQADKNKLL